MTNDEPTADTASEPQESEPQKNPAKKNHGLSLIQETVLLLGVALVMAVVIKALLVQAFYIPSESMEPGMVKNDRILVQKVSYWFGEPQRGDIVVFKDPGGWLNQAESTEPTSLLGKLMVKVGLYPTGGHLVKRVIGVEGDTIECCNAQGKIKVNGKPLTEPYIKRESGMPCDGPGGSPECNWTTGPIPKGHIFVMGDNRWHSADSSRRICRPDQTDCVPGHEFVATDLVVGRVFVLLWPFDHFTWFGRPDTFSDVPDSKAAAATH